MPLHEGWTCCWLGHRSEWGGAKGGAFQTSAEVKGWDRVFPFSSREERFSGSQ